MSNTETKGHFNWMVAPNRDLGNKHCFTHNIASNDDTNINVDGFNNLFENISDNFDKMRDHSLAQSAYHPRTPSLSLSNYNKDYTTRVQKASNRIDKDDPVTISGGIQLEYTNPKD